MLIRFLAICSCLCLAAATATATPVGATGLDSARIGHHLALGGELLTVQATSEQDGFTRWIARFRQVALRSGIAARTFDRAFRNVEYNADVVQKDRNQSEFTRQIWDYLDRAVSDTRVRNGKAALRKYRRTLDRVEAHYGVDKEIVAAIWGLESAYGSTRGDIPVIEALATLAYDGRRGPFFEQQLIAALKILQSGDVRPDRMLGSWAGAMGHTQFIPTSFLAYAVDATGDGKRDIWSDNPTDALASTAAYLARFGWQRGQPWGVEVQLPKGFDFALSGARNKRPVRDWLALGVRSVQGREIPAEVVGSILLPAGARGAAFMIFQNFRVIERYNQADAYVIAVGHLADRISGGPAIQANWPREYEPLRLADIRRLQRRLTQAGFDTLGTDGIIGPNTIAAIKAYQAAVGLIPDGYPSVEILRRLR